VLVKVADKPSCAFDQLFNTDCAGAADLVCKARMVESFFRYCDTQRIRNVNLGGIRMNVANWQEMQLWKRYVDNVVDLPAVGSVLYRQVCEHLEVRSTGGSSASRVVGVGLLPLHQLSQGLARGSTMACSNANIVFFRQA
jgi:hypothetical protein